MKRAFVNLDQICDLDKEKYETLLLDHLQLQKELVCKRRKLYKSKQKRETFLAEVRFLWHRHKHLLQIRASGVEDDLDQIDDANVKTRNLVESKRNCIVDDAPSCSPCSVSVYSYSLSTEPKEGRDQIGCNPLSIEQKAKKLFDNCKRVGKRQVSWHYKASLETIKEEEEEVMLEEQIGHELSETEKLRNCFTDERKVDQITCL